MDCLLGSLQERDIVWDSDTEATAEIGGHFVNCGYDTRGFTYRARRCQRRGQSFVWARQVLLLLDKHKTRKKINVHKCKWPVFGIEIEVLLHY